METSLKINDIFPTGEMIPSEMKIENVVNQKEYLINGELLEWNGPAEEVLSPVHIRHGDEIRPEILGSYPLLTEIEAKKALDAAVKAFDRGCGEWPTSTVEERIKALENFTFRMVETRAEVVKMLMWEIGKSYADSTKEFDRTVDYIKDTIDALKSLDRISSRFEIHQGIFGQIRRAPLGVVLCMGPYNYPLNETFTTLIPALIMGNTIIFKPAKLGVLLHRPLLKAFQESFPRGVVNTVYGDGQIVIAPLLTSGKIDVLAFIGSSKVADTLKKQHPKPHRMKSVLGLEAKNAAIILPDADLDNAIKENILGSLSYNGQRCTALKIFFVHTKVINEFLDRLSAEVSKLPYGMPWEKDVFLTPLPELHKPDYLNELIEDAKRHGAKVINKDGGMRNHSFVYPAILSPVNSKMKIYSEEQFGPLIPIVPFDDIQTPLDYVINSNFGQQVSVFGRNISDISKLIDPLVNQVCRVNINSQCQRGPDIFPFTGRKDSAEGTLSVSDALRVFSIRTLVASKMTDMNKDIFSQIIKTRKSKFLSTDFIL